MMGDMSISPVAVRRAAGRQRGRTAWVPATAITLAAFLVREARTAHPLLPLRIFRSSAVTGANLVIDGGMTRKMIYV